MKGEVGKPFTPAQSKSCRDLLETNMSFSSTTLGAPALGAHGAGTREVTTAMLLPVIPSATFPLVSFSFS